MQSSLGNIQKDNSAKNISVAECTSELEDDNDDLIAIWILRTLLYCIKNKYQKYNELDEEILEAIRMEHLDCDTTASHIIERKFKDKLKEIENTVIREDKILAHNIQCLSKILGFSDVDTDVFRFLVILNTSDVFENATDMVGGLNKRTFVRAISRILDISENQIRESFHWKNILITSGIIKFDTSSNGYGNYLCRKIEMLNGLPDALLTEIADPHDLFRSYYFHAPEPQLAKVDFSHIEKEYDLIQEYIKSAIKDKTCGVNILLYGPPGVGKTELVRTLCHDLGVEQYEISAEEKDGSALDNEDRLASFKLSQKTLSGLGNRVVMYDEVDLTFPKQLSSSHHASTDTNVAKAEINHVLESNPTPAFWITNHLWGVEQAYLRRFDYVLEMKPPTRKNRRSILSKYLVGVPVSEQWLKRMAEREKLAPASIEKAAQVVKKLYYKDQSLVESTLERIIDGTMRAMELPIRNNYSVEQNIPYCLEFLNADQNFEELTESLENHTKGRLCFYGPPGTGKTAYARYIAEKLDKPLISKRASDIINPFVGVTEINIAEMFREAKSEDGVLLLDEADSFLRDRHIALRSWEVTRVNELLVQMENHDGLFICSTNLMENLDHASLRRFDLKIYFDYLKPEQRYALFKETARSNNIDIEPSDADRICKQLARLDNLTPGDFANVSRQLTIFNQINSSGRLLDALMSECVTKKDSKIRLAGFLRN